MNNILITACDFESAGEMGRMIGPMVQKPFWVPICQSLSKIQEKYLEAKERGIQFDIIFNGVSSLNASQKIIKKCLECEDAELGYQSIKIAVLAPKLSYIMENPRVNPVLYNEIQQFLKDNFDGNFITSPLIKWELRDLLKKCGIKIRT